MSIARWSSVVGVVTMFGTSAASAHDDGPEHWKHRGPPFIPPGHVRIYEPRPVVYREPVYIYREPAYYVRPPVYYPQSEPGMSINFNFPLR